MALYLIGSNTRYLVRAKNGNDVKEMTGLSDNPERVHEEGEYGVIATVAIPSVPDAPESADEDDEIEITDLSDKGTRRYLNKNTGRTRTARRKDD